MKRQNLLSTVFSRGRKGPRLGGHNALDRWEFPMRTGKLWILTLSAVALSALPAFADTWDTCAKVEKEEDAIAACSKLIDRGKESRGNRSIIYANRGAAYLNIGDYDAALKDLDEALHLDAQSAHALYNRGATYYLKGAYEDAIRDLTRSLKLEPRAKAHFYRGRAERELDRIDDAVKDFTAAIAIDPSGADFYDYRGRAFHALDDYNSALADYDKAVAMGERGADLLNNRADVLLNLGRIDEALTGADAALTKDPAHALAMTTRGEALEKLGRRDEAVVMFNKALARDSSREDARQGLARLQGAAASDPGAVAQPPQDAASSAPAGESGPKETETAMTQDNSGASSDVDANREQLTALMGAFNNVGTSLMVGYAALAPGENVLLSPFSVGVAMAMTANGASGETEVEMRRALQLKPPRRDVAHMTMLALTLAKSERESGAPLPSWARDLDTPLARGPAVELKIANAIAPGARVKFATDYIADLMVNFGAQVLQEATLQSINAWVKEKTDGKIPGILDDLDPDFTAVILNAVSLKARWQEPFDPTNTYDATFTTARGEAKKTPMLQNVGDYEVAGVSGVRFIAVPYADPSVVMIVMLPDDAKMLAPDNILATFKGPISGGWSALAQAKPQRVRLVLPKFKFEFKTEFSAAFKLMGIKRAFSAEQAEFANMMGPSGGTVFIDKILHRTMIEVGELGTEAAAATAVVMAPGAGAAPAEPPIEFVVDRPFVFVIGDKKSGAVLFTGLVADPTVH